MKTAIISGSNGLIGSHLEELLTSKGIKTICLGRKSINQSRINYKNNPLKHYINLSMKKINELPKYISDLGYQNLENCVFYNFAWGGINNLTDGDFKDQLKNVTYGSEAIKTAKILGCKKFINSGTFEETNIEYFLKNSYPKKHKQSQINYSLAKLANRDMCKMTAYLQKIDYIHTRLSIPLDPYLKKGSYVSKTLKKIYDGKTYEEPLNKQLFDIIFVNEVAEAYFLIGKNGKNKSDYFIGTGKPITLKEYFKKFQNICEDNKQEFVENKKYIQSSYLNCFDTSLLYKDVGFQAKSNMTEIAAIQK